MTKRTRRPPSVWITQVLLTLSITPYAITLYAMIGYLVTGGLTAFQQGISVVFGLGSVMVMLLYGCAVVGMALRREAGRWLGVISLIAFLVLYACSIFINPTVYMPYDETGVLDEGPVGTFATVVPFVWAALILLLMSRLIFAKRVEDFFAPADPQPLPGPPPPPRF